MGLDGVEIVMGWEAAFGIEIPDSVAVSLRTASDAIDYIYTQVSTANQSSCVSRRAFVAVRQALLSELSLTRQAIHPSSRVRTLLPDADPRDAWRRIGMRANLPYWPSLPILGPGPTIREVTQELVSRIPGRFAPINGAWSCSEVREVVRAIIVEESGIPSTFPDGALLHDELGIN